jgi:hypothetical protein
LYGEKPLPGLRGWMERGNSENVSALSAGAYTTTWLMHDGYIEFKQDF